MDTSEVLDLSKENIQPLKQGRNAIKLGTALHAQTNAELHQKLLAEREKFELMIRMYEGDDPIKPHYEYIHWIEQSFPKHGPESNIVQVLENTLATFKDDERYKQDLRYAELLVKYIDTQQNPVEIYQLVYDQGLCTMCAPFYKAWADELDKNNDLKAADQIYELGLRVKAQPIEILQESHVQFQLSVGRRLLGHHEVEPDHNRQALHKLHKRNIHSVRDPVGAPGQIKQIPLSNITQNKNNCAPFKIYQEDDKDHYIVYGQSQGKQFPKQQPLNKENTLKAGPWTQHGGKYHSKTPAPGSTTPSFQVHEDEGVALEKGHQKTLSAPRALKPRKQDTFSCPLAVFDPPDPTKEPMYCKKKVYAGSTEFQFEELRAAIYNKHYEQLMALKIQEAICSTYKVESDVKDEPPSPVEICDAKLANYENVEKVEANNTDQLVEPPVIEPLQEQPIPSPRHPSPKTERIAKPENEPELNHERRESPLHEQHLGFEAKLGSMEAHNSLFNCQSFTFNTKEAMNLVQEMWNSPAPSPAFGQNLRATTAYQSSPVALDESGVFKIPLAPPPVTPRSLRKTPLSFPVYSDDEPASSPKSTPAFSVYRDQVQNSPSEPPFPVYNDDDDVDDDLAIPLPQTSVHSGDAPPPTCSSQPFQVFVDDVESYKPKEDQKGKDLNREQSCNNEVNKNPLVPFPTLEDLPQSRTQGEMPGADVATLKMLAFQSDSDDSNENIPIRGAVLPVHPVNRQVPSSTMSAPKAAPVQTLSHGLQTTLHDQTKFEEDITCNSKAFDFVLVSSTPFLGHAILPNSGIGDKNGINGSFVREELKKTVQTKQELSMIFEASKERYSSSSGSSGGNKTQGSVCTNPSNTIPQVQPELIEKLAQISADPSVDELEKNVSFLKISGPVDPFSTQLIKELLEYNGYPKEQHMTGLHKIDADAPVIHVNSTVKLGNLKYNVIGELGKGNYARVLKASHDGQPVALKQQRPAWQWEWYIIREIHARLPSHMLGGFLHMQNAFIYRNASILESDWGQFGSILSVVNKLKIAGKTHDLQLSLLFSIQLVTTVEYLHKCKIIHGDIKPDNFVLYSLQISDPDPQIITESVVGRFLDPQIFTESVVGGFLEPKKSEPTTDCYQPFLKLIDFGRSIDMSLFPEGTSFTTVVTTDGFQCNEMKESRPWTYQTDLFGLAGTIYCVLFYDYMKVVKRSNKWQLTSKVPRYMMPAVWQDLFSVLLNVESCDRQPDLAALRLALEEPYKTINPSAVNQSLNSLSNILQRK